MKRAASPAPVPAIAAVPTWAWLLFGSLFVAQLGLGTAFIRSAAPTYDEPVHLASGYSYLATGRYRLNILDHPPLAEMWAALPLLALRPNLLSSSRNWYEGRLYHYADEFFYQNRIPGGRMLATARCFAFFTWSALLAAILWSWARRLGGTAAALWSMAFCALCPVLVSNLALVTTDGASAILFFAVFWLLSFPQRSARIWAAAGACAGLALASKFNMILIVPLALGALLLEHGLRSSRPRTPSAGFTLFLACAAIALAAVYRFTQFPLYWRGLTATLQRLDQGRSAFFMGRYSTSGFLLYFPLAVAVKTPLPTLALGLVMSALWLRDRASFIKGLWVWVPMWGYFLAALGAKLQIGVRHLLPMMPFLALAAGCAAQRLCSKGRAGKAAAFALAAWLVASVGHAEPYLLAYFNESMGGPAQGYHYLVDSNLDWGQDLKTLGARLREMGDPPIYLSYFGSADPAAYGIRYLPIAFSINVDRAGNYADPADAGRVLFAVSATNLQCTYFVDKTLFDWLKARKPIGRFGYSIFLYDLTSDAEGRRHLARLWTLSGHAGRPTSLLIQ